MIKEKEAEELMWERRTGEQLDLHHQHEDTCAGWNKDFSQLVLSNTSLHNRTLVIFLRIGSQQKVTCILWETRKYIE